MKDKTCPIFGVKTYFLWGRVFKALGKRKETYALLGKSVSGLYLLNIWGRLGVYFLKVPHRFKFLKRIGLGVSNRIKNLPQIRQGAW